MKRKFVILLTAVVIVGFAVLVIFLSNRPTEATDPAKDYSKTAQPASQVLSDNISQSATTAPAKPAAPAPVPTPTPSTSSSTSTTIATPSPTPTTETKPSASAPTPASESVDSKAAKPLPSTPVMALLHAIGDIRL